MAMPFGRSWPLIVSLAVHGAAATALVGSGLAQKSSIVAPSIARDIWIGDTLEVSEPPGVSPGPASTSGPETVTPSAPVLVKTAAVNVHPRTESLSSNHDDGRTSLAARILSYQPAQRSTPDGSDARPKEAGPMRGRTGGMEGRPDESQARGFAKAFTRALPAANTADPIWSDLPLGHAGTVRVSVTVDDDGAIAQSKVDDKPRKPPPYLARLVERTLLLLQGGRFALTYAGKGTETLRVDVVLSDRPAESGPLSLGFEPPTVENPGRAYFQLSTGRLVEARVTIEAK